MNTEDPFTSAAAVRRGRRHQRPRQPAGEEDARGRGGCVRGGAGRRSSSWFSAASRLGPYSRSEIYGVSAAAVCHAERMPAAMDLVG
jgi:hypothetical protein